ncbi:MAG TPA: hypothetical protein VFQ58_03470 [Flavisolibacter sp.]|jgi:hypothetical protein|nr:hypothetical protein [Flavisolibacter sp.]
MNDLDILINKLNDQGLSREKIHYCFLVINEWINEEYPIMGAIVETWLKENGLNLEEIQRWHTQNL